MSVADKVAYVKAQPDVSGNHRCHWVGCDKMCKPAFWGCRRHWYMLPAKFRRAIWKLYRPGQEVDKRPSREYVEVAKEIEQWIAEHQSGHPQVVS